jgi:hypothetical protein
MRRSSVLLAHASIGLVLLSVAAATADEPSGGFPADPLAACNIVWDSPSKDSTGSLPLGNGDVALNVWAEPSGDVVFYIAKSDAWSGLGRLLKLGRVRVRCEPNPLAGSEASFQQTLRLREGRVETQLGDGAGRITLNTWVDANRPVVFVEVESGEPISLEASLELWRTPDTPLEELQPLGLRSVAGGPIEPKVEPDTLVAGQDDRIVWYHRNGMSIWPTVMEYQALAEVTQPEDDPLLHRVFGGCIEGPGLERSDDDTLRSTAPKQRHVIAICLHTMQPATGEQWRAEIDKQAETVAQLDVAQARADHERWWNDFWNRSWIHVAQSEAIAPGGLLMRKLQRNELPLRIGADSDGNNRFKGVIDRALVYDRALSPKEIAAHAAGDMPSPGKAEGAVGDWPLGSLEDGAVANRAPGDLPAKAVGEIELVQGRPESDNEKAARFDGTAFFEVDHAKALDLETAVTMEAWIRPAKTGGRIIDKTKAASASGYMIDMHPGNSLRIVLAAGNMQADVKLPENEWAHVVGLFDAAEGRKELYVNGKLVASGRQQLAEAADDEHGPAFIVTRGYALQRFVAACAGRGAYAIKFNGSLFTADWKERGTQVNADYRRWGGCYWFQNTRLPYWAMLASGDFEMMRPLFAMYQRALPLSEARTQKYFDHKGAYFPETMYFWGTPAMCDYGWDRSDKPDGFLRNSYIRYYWSGGLELTALMLDYYDHTQDEAFLRDTLLPLAGPIVTFFDQHYPRDEQGKIRFEPAQSLETWHEAVNPLPEIAGLKYVLSRMVELPEKAVDSATKKQWQRMLDELPPLPAAKEDDRTYLLPALEFSDRSNSENPPLYAVFPYRLFGLGKPDLEVGRLTFEKRRVKGTGGWRQDSIQAAYLGLTDTARAYVTQNFSRWHGDARFPAFWGPNADWIPDQDHGSVALTALQRMLLQVEGDKILVLPAWPADWNVSFKLHAPLGTTVEGRYVDGKLQQLTVTPQHRRADVEVFDPVEATQTQTGN